MFFILSPSKPHKNYSEIHPRTTWKIDFYIRLQLMKMQQNKATKEERERGSYLRWLLWSARKRERWERERIEWESVERERNVKKKKKKENGSAGFKIRIERQVVHATKRVCPATREQHVVPHKSAQLARERQGSHADDNSSKWHAVFAINQMTGRSFSHGRQRTQRQMTRRLDQTHRRPVVRPSFLIFFIFHFKSIFHLIKYIQIISKLH